MNFKKHLLRAAVLLWILFIWSNSLLTGEVSGNVSGHFSAILMALLNRAGLFIESDLFHHYIRKTAHFCEYAVLGLLVFNTCAFDPPKHRGRFFLLLWALIPACDETLQRFVPGRAGALKDCMIDMAGYLTGAFCMYLLYLVIKDLRARFH